MHFLPRTMKFTRSLVTPAKQCTAGIAASLLALLSLALTATSHADVVTLKDGTSVEGRIIVEGSDILRIEVQVTPSIKETKTYSMTDVAKVEKTAPDKLAFAAIKELMPTQSLMTASDYDRIIKDGPRKFLSNFADSEHKAEVETILTELEAEKERVQRGGIKLDGEWIDREERQLYRFAVDARVRLDRIRQKAQADNLLGALRDFQSMGESFAETPAYVTAIEEAQKIISAWGSTLQRKLANVDILNERDDASLALAAEDQRRRTQEARDAERQRFSDLLRQEKDKGIVWVSVSDRDKQSLENAISIAKAQLDRLRAMDIAALKKQAEGLTEANRLLGEGDLAEARLAIAEAAVGRSSSSKSRSRSRSKSKTAANTTPTSYSQWLTQRITDEETTLAENARAKAAAAEAAAAAKIAAGGDAKKDDAEATTDGEVKADGETATATDAPATAGTPSRAEIMAAEKAREQAKKAAEEKAAADADSKKKSRSKKGSGDDEDEDGKKKPAPAASGGGINIQVLVPIIAVLLMVTILVLKKFGIGGKPAAGGDDAAPPAE